MAEGVDFAFGRPGGSALRAAGKSFVGRYLSGWQGKGVTRAELDDYAANELGVFFIYEETGTELLGGFSAGVRVARDAEALRISLGLPPVAIHFTADSDISGAELAASVSAIDGAVSVLGYSRVGGYGGVAFIKALAGHCKYAWQTYAWSKGQIADNATLYQYRNSQTINGAAVDLCKNLSADFGALGGSVLMPSDSSSLVMPLLLDGIVGPQTIMAEQKALGVAIDGVRGPQTVRAEQVLTGATVDGIDGPDTRKHLQEWLDVTSDGIVGIDTGRALQSRLNAGTFTTPTAKEPPAVTNTPPALQIVTPAAPVVPAPIAPVPVAAVVPDPVVTAAPVVAAAPVIPAPATPTPVAPLTASQLAALAASLPQVDSGLAPLSGLLAGSPKARKNGYYAFAGLALLISFGPDVVIAGILTNSQVGTLDSVLALASSVLLKIGVAFGFVAASNTK